MPYALCFLFGGQFDTQAMDTVVDADLAAEAAVVFGGIELVQHFLFFVRLVAEVVVAEDVDVAAAAEGYASAGAEDREFVGFAGFHDIEADVRGDFEGMYDIIAVEDLDGYQTCFLCFFQSRCFH